MVEKDERQVLKDDAMVAGHDAFLEPLYASGRDSRWRKGCPQILNLTRRSADATNPILYAG